MVKLLARIVEPYRTIDYPEPPDFLLSSTPADAARDHLRRLREISEHNRYAFRCWARLIYWIMFGAGLLLLADIFVTVWGP